MPRLGEGERGGACVATSWGRDRALVPRRWRFYRTVGGREPVREALDALSPDDRAAVLGEMKHVASAGLSAARHLREDLYEVRVFAERGSYRVLFAVEGARGQVLLALEAFSKKSQATPLRELDVALRRLRDWRSRSR